MGPDCYQMVTMGVDCIVFASNGEEKWQDQHVFQQTMDKKNCILLNKADLGSL